MRNAKAQQLCGLISKIIDTIVKNLSKSTCATYRIPKGIFSKAPRRRITSCRTCAETFQIKPGLDLQEVI